MRMPTRPALLIAAGVSAWAQGNAPLTLQQAVDRAIRNHPAIESASLNAQAAGAVVNQVRAAAQPQLTANLTGVGADRDSAIAAGTLQTSGLSSRAASGVGFSQLVTDFGRVSRLTDSVRLRAAAQDRNVAVTRSQIALQVHQAYYGVLAADAVLQVAAAQLEMQRVTLRQVKALADSNLRSTLDVSFAEVAVSQADLALYQAENSSKASYALLAAAMGETGPAAFSVTDVTLPPRTISDLTALVREALNNRPELAAAKLMESSAVRTAEAEKRLRYPTISVAGVYGAVPVHQRNFATQYSAAGVNISIPLLNSALSARAAEAELRARGAAKEEQALEVQIAGSVRVAWFDAENAWRRIEVTTRLVEQTGTALRLANARYEAGLGGIIELTQAQLAQTSAQTSFARAKYDYLLRVSNLEFAIGALQ